MELMVDVSRGAESWLPAALADALCAHRTISRAPRDALEAWLRSVRRTTEEYDAQGAHALALTAAVRPPPEEEPEPSPEDAFDDILSQLGNEIFQLDEYQRRFAPETGPSLADSILELFDVCLEEMTGPAYADLAPSGTDSSSLTFETASPTGDDGDEPFTLCEEALATSTPSKQTDDAPDELELRDSDKTRKTSDVNRIFDDGTGAPTAPRRRNRRGTLSSGSSTCDNMDRGSPKPRGASNVESLKSHLDSDSDSSTTRWNYLAGSTDTDNGSERDDYAPVWTFSSGFHNSDDILYRVIKQNHAEVHRISYDTVSEMSHDRYTVYRLPEVGCERGAPDAERPVVARDMKPTVAQLGEYASVRDARDAGYKYVELCDENIYEEIDYSCEDRCSFGSVEVVSCDESGGSEGEDPLYVNLLDNAAYRIGADVLAWRQLMFHPDYCDDEEDEWISNEESLIYAQDQRPPYIIPRITSYRAYPRAPRHHDPAPLSYPEETLAEVPLAMKDVRQMFEGGRGAVGDWSPLSERSKTEIERAFGGGGSPPLTRLPKRLGGSNENMLGAGARRPSNPLYLGEHSSGDSLDLERRALRPHDRRRKSKSMIPRGKSPMPAPRSAPVHIDVPRAAPAHGDAPDGHIFAAYVKRTKFSENGKKARKNWTESYLVLTATHLLFYKDAKAYQAALAKSAGPPPSPTGGRGAELALPLRGAAVDRCTQQHTSRYTRSIVVTAGSEQLLVQDVSPAGAAYWYETIDRSIARLPADFLCVTPQQLEAFGTPPGARKHKNHKVGDSSNEDLSDSTERAKTRNKLRKFFTRRPTMEVLIKKGIYQDEPVFGRNLEEVCPGPDVTPRVPEFVVRCVHEIESSESNMHTDGLYRASGNLSQVQKIRLQIDQNNLDIMEHSSDVHVLTGSLKLFFRELKEPLIPCKLFNRILAATGIKSREGRIKEFRDIVGSLPQCNWDTLKFLLEHLLRVTEHAAQNRMHVSNLAIVFGPTLLWAPAELAHNIAIDCIQQNHAIEILLVDFQHIFSNTRPKKKS